LGTAAGADAGRPAPAGRRDGLAAQPRREEPAVPGAGAAAGRGRDHPGREPRRPRPPDAGAGSPLRAGGGPDTRAYRPPVKKAHQQEPALTRGGQIGLPCLVLESPGTHVSWPAASGDEWDVAAAALAPSVNSLVGSSGGRTIPTIRLTARASARIRGAFRSD